MRAPKLPFWDFFEELEKKLSFERWIDKYRQFVLVLQNGYISYDDQWMQFRQFCKALLLQDFRDERVFDQLLDTAIEKEKTVLWNLFDQKKPEAGTAAKRSSADHPPAKADTDTAKVQPPQPRENASATDAVMPEPPDHQQAIHMQFLPPQVAAHEQVNLGSPEQIRYLHTDEYFPVTRRQMVKAWQFLRLKEASDAKEGIDITGTIRQIAKDGLFLEPVYNAGMRNREDTLIIFADFRGSMTPFHELTSRLIETARGGGGHPRVPVYYFQNHPVGYVFKNPNMSGPVKIKEALLKTNRNFTLAVVISDAGAARGNNSPERRQSRSDITSKFLEFLDETCAHTIWLNPMPMHRWQGNAAELISKKVFLMAPVLDRYGDKFQETLRTILKHQKPALTN